MTGPGRPRILVVDNYDSFVWNLVHYLAQLGAHTEVWRNDDARFGDLSSEVFADFDGILLSPGPGAPAGAGVCVDLVRKVGGRIPIFGVCLGLQAIAVAFGGEVGRSPELLHGKVSPVSHQGVGTMAGLPNPFTATRYHSLAVTRLPDCLEVTGATDDGTIMTVRHRELPIEAVQFHPESVLTEGGYQMLGNWLAICGDAAAPGRAVGLAPLMSLG
ncbi:MAG: aminodeoxychorismate/anthranilate synthase component II [Propionibacteriaceae bacterium]|nr:aminodeoxychorismate/anthranilate synthase component II [Propionibacteriaceae bacterium]